MSMNESAPQFFVAGIQGLTPEGPNVVLSFATPIPSGDHKESRYCTNVRIAMSSDAAKQMVEFLIRAEAQPGVVLHAMPKTKH